MRPPPRIAVGNIPHNIVRYIVRSIVGLFDSLNCCAKYHKLARIIACNVVRNRYPLLKFSAVSYVILWAMMCVASRVHPWNCFLQYRSQCCPLFWKHQRCVHHVILAINIEHCIKRFVIRRIVRYGENSIDLKELRTKSILNAKYTTPILALT